MQGIPLDSKQGQGEPQQHEANYCNLPQYSSGCVHMTISKIRTMFIVIVGGS